MNTKRLFLEESGFAEVEIANLEKLVEEFCDVVVNLRGCGEEICRSAYLEDEKVGDGISVNDLLYGSILPQDLKARFIEALNRCTYWNDLVAEDLQEFMIANQSVLGLTLTHAFNNALRRGAICCAGLKFSWEVGVVDVSRVSDNQSSRIYFLAGDSAICDFFRFRLSVEDLNEAEFMRTCGLAFPNLFFANGLLGQIRRFSHSFEEVRNIMITHFIALNDQFRAVFSKHNGAPQVISAEMSALTGVSMSPESPSTHGNSSAMREREISVEKKIICCEWHTKLFPTTDRIYFHPGTDDVALGKVIVGIFSDHLPT